MLEHVEVWRCIAMLLRMVLPVSFWAYDALLVAHNAFSGQTGVPSPHDTGRDLALVIGYEAANGHPGMKPP